MTEPKVFISYSRNDLQFAQKIVDALAANDLDTCIEARILTYTSPYKENEI